MRLLKHVYVIPACPSNLTGYKLQRIPLFVTVHATCIGSIHRYDTLKTDMSRSKEYSQRAHVYTLKSMTGTLVGYVVAYIDGTNAMFVCNVERDDLAIRIWHVLSDPYADMSSVHVEDRVS